MYQHVHNSASSGGPVAGDNFWAWAGEGRPLLPYGSYWSPGDPWIGDPPHEHQGWYSVYDSDATSLAESLLVPLDEQGFFGLKGAAALPALQREGIFVAGACESPKDIQSCMAQAEMVSAAVLSDNKQRAKNKISKLKT